jgi:hypothetical protein
MEPSEEVRRTLDRWLAAARAGDADTFVGKVAEDAGVLMIGTDEEEGWHRTDAAVWKQRLEETGGFPFLARRPSPTQQPDQGRSRRARRNRGRDSGRRFDARVLERPSRRFLCAADPGRDRQGFRRSLAADPREDVVTSSARYCEALSGRNRSISASSAAPSLGARPVRGVGVKRSARSAPGRSAGSAARR